MENLRLYTPNGVEIPLVSYANNSIPTEVKCTIEWQGDESISLRIESAMPIDIPLYSYVDYKGVRFRMSRPAEVKKEYDTLEYGIELESARYELGRVLYDTSVDPTQAALSKVYSGGSFGNLYHFADILAANIKRALGVTWKIEGAAKDDKGGQLLSFERSENCLSALHKIAQAFHVFFFTSEDVNSGVRTIRFVSEYEYNPQPREEWNIGSELFSVDRKYMGSDNVITRLWAFGSQEGAEKAGDRLTLPSKDMTNSYIEDSEKVRLYGLSEGVYIDEEAKPTYTGDVTKETDDPYTFQSASWLMFSKLQDGETAKVHFETGGLQGMEFSVKRVKDGKITINPIVDKDLKLEYPSKDSSSPYRIKAGDTFKCLGVEYPLWITLSARDRLQASATLHYNEVSSPKMEYSLVLRDGFETSVKVGDVVTIVDDSIPQGGRANLIVQQIDVDIIARECSIQVSNFRRKRRIEEIYKGWKERLNGILDYLNLKGYQAESFAWFKGLEEHSSLLDRRVELKEDKSNAKTKYEQLDSEIHKRVPREFFDRKIAEYVPTSEFQNRINGLVPLKDFTDLRTIVNNEISSWTLESVPSTINKDIQAATIRSYNAEPYNSWGAVGSERNLDAHVGDTWLVNKAGIPENGKVYRFVKGSKPNTYRWVQLADSPALDALNKIASLSQSLSDTKEYFNTNLGARVFDEFNARKEELKGENGAGVRANLWKNDGMFFSNNSRIDKTKCDNLGDGVYRITKGTPVAIHMYSEFTHKLSDELTNKVVVHSFRFLRSSRPEIVDLSKLSEKNGRYYMVYNNERKNVEIRGAFKFFTKNNMQFQDGDWVEFCDYKVELVDEGEPIEPTAYIPHPEDLKGKKGLPAAPIRPNLLKGYIDRVVTLEARDNGTSSDNYNYNWLVGPNWLEDGKAYVVSADFDWVGGEKPDGVSLLMYKRDNNHLYSTLSLDGRTKARVSIYIPAGVHNTSGIAGYAGQAGKTRGVAARYSNIKLEEVQEGEPKEASAYLPHTDDLKVPLSSVVEDLKEQGISNEVKELLKADNNFVKATKGADGHNPSPEEVLGTSRFAELLGSEVTQQVKPVRDNLDTANTHISALQKVALTPQQRTDLGYLTYSLQLLKSGGNGTLEGLSLQRYIALSGDKQTVSAYLASNALPAVLKAGITGFGTPNEREQVEITHTGTGHIGNLYFSGSQIDFRTSRDTDPYLSIGAEENQFIDNFIDTARLDDTPVSVGTVTLTTRTTSDERTVDVANDGTRLTVSIGDITVETFMGATTRITLDGEVLDEWRGNISISEGGNIGGIVVEPQYSEKPYIASNLSYERVVKAGRHTLRIEIIKPNSGATATIRGLRVRRRYDTGRQQSALTKSGLRLFGSPDRYFDVDYRPTYQAHLGAGYDFNLPNPYLVRIKGGAKVDKLTVDELDMPGVPLCGASFNENGGQEKAFGKRAKRQGGDRAQAVYDYGMTAYKVYHSIGHTNYIPIVQVSGWTSGDLNWSLTPRVYDVKPDYFVVRILTNNDNPQKKAISYVAYKTE